LSALTRVIGRIYEVAERQLGVNEVKTDGQAVKS
jgi:hypothetical protein